MSDYVEVELWLDDHETVDVLVMSPSGNRIVASLKGVSGNPVLSKGVWEVSFQLAGKSCTACLPANLVGWFVRVDDTYVSHEPEVGGS